MTSLSDKLIAARKLLELTQKEAAMQSGIAQSDISQMENGYKKFIPLDYIKFLNKKEIDLNLLFNEEIEDVFFATGIFAEIAPKVAPIVAPNSEIETSNDGRTGSRKKTGTASDSVVIDANTMAYFKAFQRELAELKVRLAKAGL